MLLIIVTHYGRLGDGQYEYWDEIFYDGAAFRRTYHSNADFDYCRIFSQFQQCWSCEHYNRENGDCLAVPEEVTIEEINAIAADLDTLPEVLIEMIKASEKFVVDGTGHEYSPCPNRGGCKICYPCYCCEG